MACAGVFTYDVLSTLISSNQTANFQGSASIPAYTINDGWSSSICFGVCCGWWGSCSSCPPCYNIDPITIQVYPEVGIKGNGSMNSTIISDSAIIFNTTNPPTETIISSLIITAVYLDLTFIVGDVTVSTGNLNMLPDGEKITVSVTASGTYSAEILLAGYTKDYEGVGMTLSANLLFCETPGEGLSWLNMTGTISLSYLGNSASVNYTFPITDE